ncbi:MAG: PAS domain S-box protein [Chitinivibrionales bacterium]|nr:PAS domain S-box protein [Chitinivibrionales bacterium]
MANHRQIDKADGSFRDMVDMSADGIVVIDSDGVIRFANPAACALFGMGPDALVGYQIGFPAGTAEPVEVVLSPGAGFRTTVEMRATDITWHGQPAFLANLRDVSERKRMQVELSRAQERLAAFYRSSTDGIKIFDADGRLIDLNDAFYRITGYDRQELLDGTTYQEITAPAFRAMEAAEIERVLQTGLPREYEKEFVRKDGGRVPVRLTTFVIKDERDRTMGLAAIVKDITQRKRAEHSIMHLNSVLRVVRDVNKLIVRAQNRTDLLREACQVLVGTRGYQHACVAVLEDGGAVGDVFEAMPDDGGPGVSSLFADGNLPSCCRESVEHRRVVLRGDQSEGCRECPLYGRYYGWLRMTAAVEHEGDLLGLLSLVAPRAYAQDAEEQELVQELANDLGQALHGFALEEARTEAETALRSSEERFRLLFSGMNEGVAFNRMLHNDAGKSVDYVLTDVNGSFERITGIPRARAVGARASELLGSSEPPLLADIATVLETGEPRSFETSAAEVDRHFWVSVVPVGKNEFVALFGDITARVHAERAMKRSELLLRAAERMAQVGAWEWDLVHDELTFSDEWLRIHGCTQRTMTREDLLPVAHPDDRPRIEKALRAVVAGESGYSMEHRIINQSTGETRYIHSHGEVVRDDQGAPVRMYGSAKDITDYRRALEALRESEERFRRFFESDPEYCYIVSPQGTVVDANKAALDGLGFTRDELIGKDVISLYAPECRERARGLFVGWERGHDLRNEELVVLTGDAKRRTVLLSATAIRAEDGSLLHSVSVQRDITDLKVAQEQLRQAQKLEAIGQLAGGVAHDFNNLLGGITGYADLLKERIADRPGLIGYVERILTSSTRAASLTRQLLTFARRTEAEMVPCDVHECIRQVVDVLQRTIDRRIAVSRDLRADASIINGDRAQIENALLNMGVNARDAMPDGGKLVYETETVTLSSSAELGQGWDIAPGDYLRVRVTDTGVGMNEETRNRIFEPFYTTKELGKGTGLGLASAYGAVRQHGGYITVDSTQGEGSVFTVYLPLLDGVKPSAPHTADAEPRHGRGTILLIDDDEFIRDSSGEILTTLGYAVHRCEDGREGLEWFVRNRDDIDLVILDLVMPGMSGLDCLRKVKAVRREAKIIAISGFAERGHQSAAMAEGAVAFLEKPFDMKQLAQVVAQAIEGG